MKTLALLATTTLLAAVVMMPVSAEPCNVKTESAVVQTERAKPQGIHLFRAKKIAMKQDGSQPAETVKPARVNLDYATDNFIIN